MYCQIHYIFTMTFFKQPLPDGGRESSLNYRQTYFGHGDIFLFTAQPRACIRSEKV